MDNSPINRNKSQNKKNKKEQDILRSNIYKYYNDNYNSSSFNNNSNISNYNTNYNINSNTNIKNSLNNNSINNNNSFNNIKQEKENNQKKQELLKTINEETTQYVEEMKKGTYNILVAVRCRPLSLKEREISLYETLQIMERKIIILKDPNGISNPNNVRTKEQTLAFDYAFDQFEGQEDIFSCTTKFLIGGVTNGFNATVFAYGATGAGKTYTMLGNEENPGIMSLTLNELFNKINSYPEREYIVKLWYLEIYNENIRDLLVNNSENLELREDPNRGLIVNGITEIVPKSSEHILSILKKGNKNRTTESTNANETSSRSHAILQINVNYKEKVSGINYEIKYGKLNLIDLAGSERASVTKNKGVRLFEGANINKSLLTLGNCINALCEANEKGIKTYVPYRDSKLTRLLKDSLGGNARTVMIANVSPFINSFDDTYNTLKYADRAKHIKTNIKRNVLNAQYHITNYKNIIKNLQNRVFELENQLSITKKRDFTATPIKLNRNEINDNISQNKKLLNRNSFIGLENKNLRINKEKEKDTKNNSLINFDSNNNSNINNSKIYCKEDKELEMQYNSIIKEFIISSKKEVKLKEKVMNLQQELFLVNNSININEFYGVDTTELKNKEKNIKKLLETTEKFLFECSQRNNEEYKLLIEDDELKEEHKKYLISTNENTKIKLENIDMKMKLFVTKTNYNNSKVYIKDLEEQIKIRDVIISKNSEIFFKDNKEEFLKVLNDEQISKYKELNQIHKKNNFIFHFNSENTKIDYFKKTNKKSENLKLDITENNSYTKINNPFLKNSNSTFQIMPVLSEVVENQNKKIEPEGENNKLYLPPLSLKINNIDLKFDEDINNKSIKSMLNNIQAVNSDISFKINMIEQKSNKLKNKNNNSPYNLNDGPANQSNTINNVRNNIHHYFIPNNNTFKTKNLLKKDQDRSAQIYRLNTNKTNNFSFNSLTKKLKNVPSLANMKSINNSGNNILKNNNMDNNINKDTKNIISNSPWKGKNMPVIDTKNNKNENRPRTTLSRNIKILPRSAKSRTNSKNQKKVQNDIIEKNKKNDNKKRLDELLKKGKEEINNNSMIVDNKIENNNYINYKRKNKFQNSDLSLNNRKSSSFGENTSNRNAKQNKSNENKQKKGNNSTLNHDFSNSKEKSRINKPESPFYHINKLKNKISQDLIN